MSPRILTGVSVVRLSYVTQWFPPEPEGASVWIAEALRDHGYEVRVVTGVPHYPTGSPAEGHRAIDWRLGSIRGFRTLRVPEFPSHDTRVARRIATFGSFAVSSAALASGSIGKGDVTLVYSSPATSALPAMVARARHGTPYVLLVQDLWPDSIFATGFLTAGPLKRTAHVSVSAFVNSSYRSASHVCVITPGMRRALIERGVPEDKITLVYNWVDEQILKPATRDGVLRRELGLGSETFIALFAGNAGEAQGLVAWLEALARLAELPDTHLVFLGGGTQRECLRRRAYALGVQGRAHFLEPVPPIAVPAFVADADVSVVSLADRRLFEITMPSKVQANLAMASPIIASCAGDVAEVVLESGAGWVARPEDPFSIAEAIKAAVKSGPAELATRGQRGLHYYKQHMSREAGSARLAEVLRVAAATRTCPGPRRSRR